MHLLIAIIKTRLTTTAFDPKPLIRSFENAIAQLTHLSDELDIRESELSTSVRRADALHSQNVESLGIKLKQTIESFHQLDSSFDSRSTVGEPDVGGNVAVKIGESLEELDRQRQRAQDAKFLIQCWIEVGNRGDISALEDVRRLGGSEGKVRCANIARQLLKISSRLDPDDKLLVTNQRGASSSPRSTRETIEKFLEALETDLLKQFDSFYRRQNFEGMKVSAEGATLLVRCVSSAMSVSLRMDWRISMLTHEYGVTQEHGLGQ